MAVSEKTIKDKIERTSLVEELRKEWENSDLAFNTKYSHKEDLEKLLKLAEELKEKCDNTESKIILQKKRRFLSILISVLLVLGLLIIFFLSDTGSSENYLANIKDWKYVIGFTGIILGGILGFLLGYTNTEFLRMKFKLDELALSEVLQLLRETSDIIAEQEDWSVLSRAEFRIRLSRFNLGKYESKFGFFS